MTPEEKKQISYLRYAGKCYRDIAKALDLKETTVKTYCFRHELTDKCVAEYKKENHKNICPYCGKFIVQRVNQKPRRFCSDKCRYAWWNQNQNLKPRSTSFKFICKYCGKECLSYGDKNRKYCSHQCYIADRYGPQGISAEQDTI